MAGTGTTLAVLGIQGEETVRNENSWSQQRAHNLWESSQTFQSWGIGLASAGGAVAIGGLVWLLAGGNGDGKADEAAVYVYPESGAVHFGCSVVF